MKPLATAPSTSVLLATLLILFAAPPAFAQLELDPDGNIGIGVPPGDSWKLRIEGSNSKVINAYLYAGAPTHAAIYGKATGATAGLGIGGDFVGGHMALRAYATEGGASNATGLFARVAGATGNTGVSTYVTGGTNAIGLFGDARLASAKSYGFKGLAKDAPENYGGVGSAYATGSGTAHGLNGYARSQDAAGIAYGVYGRTSGSGTRFAGFFEGNLTYTGTFGKTSDAKFKQAVETLGGEGLLAKVLALKPRRYRYKQDALGRRLGFPEGVQFGFVAQELEAEFPELVEEQRHVSPAIEAAPEPWEGEGPPPEPKVEEEAMEVSYKAVNYLDLIPVLVGAIQEQQAEIAALKAALGKLGVTVE